MRHAMPRRAQRRFARPREIRLTAIDPSLYDAIVSAATTAGISVEVWLVEAAELALLLGKTR